MASCIIIFGDNIKSGKSKYVLFVVLFAVACKIFMGVFFQNIGIAGFWNRIPSLFRYRPALQYRPVTDFYGIPAEGYMEVIRGKDHVCVIIS